QDYKTHVRVITNSMKPLIGICSLDKIIVEDLKRYLLFFDKLHIVGAKEWLFDVHNKNNDIIARPFINQVIYSFWKDLSKKGRIDYKTYINLISLFHELLIRDSSTWMNLNISFETYPLIDNFTVLKELATKKQIVFRNTINKISMPSPEASWESIFEFKND